jgi:PAS domain S-box-containing protein
MKMVSISERINELVSRLRDAVAAPNPETRFESTSRIAASLAIASGFITLAWIALVPADRRVITLAVALGFFVLAFVYLSLSKRWPLLPNSFGVIGSLLVSVGVWADSGSWALSLIVYCLASMYAAYFISLRGMALQLTVASGSFFAAQFAAEESSHQFIEWITVTTALVFFALAVFLAKSAAGRGAHREQPVSANVLENDDAVDQLVEDLRARARGQQIVAGLGQRALIETDIDALMQEAARAVDEALTLDRVVIFQNVSADGLLSMRTSAGRLATAFELDSALTPDAFSRYALYAGEPVVVTDLARETRFDPPPALLELGIVSAANVVIPGHEHPWGVIGVRSVQSRVFSDGDLDFLRSLANVLGLAIEQHEYEETARAIRAKTAELNERLGAVIDASPVAIIEIDLEHRVNVWNEVAETIFGWSSEEVIGKILPVVPEHRLEEFEDLVGRAIKGEQITAFETERHRRDGTLIPYLITPTAIRSA